VNIHENMTRENQESLILGVVKSFKAKCAEAIDLAIRDDLKARPGWMGSIRQWLYDKLGIH